jgi:hypothetical protein
MHPWCRFGLAHAEQPAMEQVRGMLFEVDQNAEEPIFWGRHGTGEIGRIASRLPAPSMQGPGSHIGEERGLKRRHQSHKLVHGQACQISDLGSMGCNIAVT